MKKQLFSKQICEQPLVKDRNFATTRSLCFSSLQTIDNSLILVTTLQQNTRKLLFCGHWTSWQSLIFTNVLTYYVTSMCFRKKALRCDFSNPRFLPFAWFSCHEVYTYISIFQQQNFHLLQVIFVLLSNQCSILFIIILENLFDNRAILINYF